MPAARSSAPALPVAWIQVLDAVAETVRQTEAAAADRERALGQASAAAAAAEAPAAGPEDLQQLEEQGRGWPAALEQAGKEASAAEAELQAAEAALRQWLHTAQTLEQRLAKWVKHTV